MADGKQSDPELQEIRRKYNIWRKSTNRIPVDYNREQAAAGGSSVFRGLINYNDPVDVATKTRADNIRLSLNKWRDYMSPERGNAGYYAKHMELPPFSIRMFMGGKHTLDSRTDPSKQKQDVTPTEKSVEAPVNAVQEKTATAHNMNICTVRNAMQKRAFFSFWPQWPSDQEVAAVYGETPQQVADRQFEAQHGMTRGVWDQRYQEASQNLDKYLSGQPSESIFSPGHMIYPNEGPAQMRTRANMENDLRTLSAMNPDAYNHLMRISGGNPTPQLLNDYMFRAVPGYKGAYQGFNIYEYGNYTPKQRNQILSAARELGVKPNQIAAVRLGQSGLINGFQTTSNPDTLRRLVQLKNPQAYNNYILSYLKPQWGANPRTRGLAMPSNQQFLTAFNRNQNPAWLSRDMNGMHLGKRPKGAAPMSTFGINGQYYDKYADGRIVAVNPGMVRGRSMMNGGHMTGTRAGRAPGYNKPDWSTRPQGDNYWNGQKWVAIDRSELGKPVTAEEMGYRTTSAGGTTSDFTRLPQTHYKFKPSTTSTNGTSGALRRQMRNTVNSRIA